MNDLSVDTLIRGSVLRGRSSAELAWEGLLVERRAAPPVERIAEELGCHYALLWCGKPTVTERAYTPGKYTRMVKQPGTISLGTAGYLPAVRVQSPYNVVACVVDPVYLDRLVSEFDQDTGGLHEQLGCRDPALVSLIGLAAEELDNGGAGGKLYADSLCLTIINRFVYIARRESAPITSGKESALPPPRLKRVLEKIQSDFTGNLSLDDLAAESGYSRAHFLRMFRIATGKTPHRYLQEFRLDQARMQLETGRASLSDIAMSVGFSSHSHLTRLFRRAFGATPADYRRDMVK
jgi:AraC family transcriptional regulator